MVQVEWGLVQNQKRVYRASLESVRLSGRKRKKKKEVVAKFRRVKTPREDSNDTHQRRRDIRTNNAYFV